METRFLKQAASTVIERDGVQAVVLAGTDFSSFYADRPPVFPYLDVAGLHIDRIVQLARESAATAYRERQLLSTWYELTAVNPYRSGLLISLTKCE